MCLYLSLVLFLIGNCNASVSSVKAVSVFVTNIQTVFSVSSSAIFDGM